MFFTITLTATFLFANSASTKASITILANYTRDFTIRPLVTSVSSVTILSVSSDGRRLLAGHYNEQTLHIYNITDTGSTYVRSLQLPGRELLEDAVWAPYNGSIVCSTNDARWPVLVMSVFGDVIANSVDKQGLIRSEGLHSVASDNIIYYSSSILIHKAKDNGVIALQETILQTILTVTIYWYSKVESSGFGNWQTFFTLRRTRKCKDLINQSMLYIVLQLMQRMRM